MLGRHFEAKITILNTSSTRLILKSQPQLRKPYVITQDLRRVFECHQRKVADHRHRDIGHNLGSDPGNSQDHYMLRIVSYFE